MYCKNCGIESINDRLMVYYKMFSAVTLIMMLLSFKDVVIMNFVYEESFTDLLDL